MKRVLVLSPHPDDESIGPGGTLCKHAAEGAEIRIVVLTSGERGGHGLPQADVARIREDEVRRAARHLRAREIEFWRAPDGALRATRELCDRLRAVVHAYAPQVIYLPHDREAHPDHRATVRMLRGALSGVGRRQPAPRLLTFEIWTPLQRIDEIVDITPFVEQKRAAIRCHESQCRVVAFDDAALALNRYRGELHCWPEGDYAEVFARLEP